MSNPIEAFSRWKTGSGGSLKRAATSAPSCKPGPLLAAKTEAAKDAGSLCAGSTGATEDAGRRRFAASQSGCDLLDGALALRRGCRRYKPLATARRAEVVRAAVSRDLVAARRDHHRHAA